MRESRRGARFGSRFAVPQAGYCLCQTARAAPMDPLCRRRGRVSTIGKASDTRCRVVDSAIPPGILREQRPAPLGRSIRARGGIGRRACLRGMCPQGRAGSTPVGPIITELHRTRYGSGRKWEPQLNESWLGWVTQINKRQRRFGVWRLGRPPRRSAWLSTVSAVWGPRVSFFARRLPRRLDLLTECLRNAPTGEARTVPVDWPYLPSKIGPIRSRRVRFKESVAPPPAVLRPPSYVRALPADSEPSGLRGCTWPIPWPGTSSRRASRSSRGSSTPCRYSWRAS